MSREVVERQSRIRSFTTLAVLSGVALAAIGVLALISIGWRTTLRIAEALLLRRILSHDEVEALANGNSLPGPL